MTANELAKLCVNEWVSSDHVLWLMNTLNKSQGDTYCIYLNKDMHKAPTTIPPFLAEDTKPSKLCFVVAQKSFANVGKGQRGKTFLGSFGHLASHWSMYHIDTIAKKVFYGDSLGWPVPENLFAKPDIKIQNIPILISASFLFYKGSVSR